MFISENNKINKSVIFVNNQKIYKFNHTKIESYNYIKIKGINTKNAQIE